MIMESKKRYVEQVTRDQNNMQEILSPMEIEELRRQITILQKSVRDLNEELQKRTGNIDKMTIELHNAQYAVANAEKNNTRMEQKLEEMAKKEAHSQARIEEAHRQGEKMVKDLEQEFEKERDEARSKSQQIEFLMSKKNELEKMVIKLENDKGALRAQTDKYEQDIGGFKVSKYKTFFALSIFIPDLFIL